MSLATNIRRQRDALGLDTSLVAKIARLSEARVREVESGQSPSVWEMSRIARALAADPAMLVRGELDDPRYGVARFRASATELGGGDLRRLAFAAEAGRIAATLAQGKPSRIEELRRVEALTPGEAPFVAGYRLGALARFRCGGGTAPLPSVQALVEQLGVVVLHVGFESKSVDGASFFEPGAMPVIVLNANGSRYPLQLARRAILAHELCHLLHDSSSVRDMVSVVSRAESRDALEQRANGFAPSFIAPRDAVSLDYPRSRRRPAPRAMVIGIAEKWGLSFEGATYHAKNLKLVSQADEEALLRERPAPRVSDQSFREAPPAADFSDLVDEEALAELSGNPFAESALGVAVVEAYRRDAITRGRAIEILLMGADVVS